MHICLPDTREIKPAHGAAYLLYNVHIDGLYHCSLRYKQFLHLHQALSKKFASPYHQLAQFPPKKLLPLSASQVEDRRQSLEKYLQNISQDKAISNSSIFNLFLLEAQRESTKIREDQVHLDIELVNGQKIRLQILTHDSADAVLTSVCRALGLDDRYHAYFCLCLCGYDVIRDKLIIKRRLSFFESPYVTLQMAIQQQEQLQNVFTNYTTDINNTIIDNNNINLNNCRCQSCLQRYNQQQQQLFSCNSANVPLIGSSSGQRVNNSNNNNCNHYNNININNNHDGDNNQYHIQNFYNVRHSTSTSGATSNNNNPLIFKTTTFVTHRILLRKSYWDPIYDTYILNDQQALNLLFIQTVYDIKHSLMFVDKETYHQLESLLASDSKMDYILLARTLKYYNYVHFEPCYSDYPRPRTKVMISIGSKELNMRVLKSPKTFKSQTSAISSSSNNTTNTTTSTTITPPQSSSSSSSSSSSTSSTSTTSSSQESATTIINTNKQTVARYQQQQQQQTSSSSMSSSSEPLSPTGNQQVSVSSEQEILYCTSTWVPSGYQHLITKEDLVEEEYNFKVPLIRCWRLTSLETLNSNNNSIGAPAPSCKGLSFFGSSTSSSSSGCSSSNGCNNEDRPILDCNSYNNNNNNNHHHHHRNLINSGNGGLSLMAALTGVRNGRAVVDNQNGHHQHCQHENHHCNLAQYNIDQSQFSQYELSFEYLVAKDTLRWITISSDQAIFISISLQGVVDELVSKRDVRSCHYKGTSDAPNILPVIVGANSTSINNQNVTNGNANSNSDKSTSFTYMYRDGTQKLMSTSKQQLIDKFGTTLGYSPSSSQAVALARQRQQQQQLRASASNGGGLFLSSNSRLTAALSGLSTVMSTSPPETAHHQYPVYHNSQMQFNYQQQHHQQQQQQQHAFEISNLKKASSPIINDAFEGVTNEDDL